MSPAVSRMMLSFAMVFASIVGFPLVLAGIDLISRHMGIRDWAIIATPVVFIIAFGCGWTLIWLPQVKWTRRRIASTVVAGFLTLVGGGVLIAMCFLLQPYMNMEAAAFFGIFIWLTLWISFTAIVWRDTLDEQVQRLTFVAAVKCRMCGYDMRGLREPRCPECGKTYTLDELLVSSRGDHYAGE